MQLKAVCRVSVCNLGFKIRGQIDDIDRTERALLWANTASNTKVLGDERDFRLWGNFDTEFAASNHRARLLTFLSAFLNNHLVFCLETRDSFNVCIPLACTR